MTQNLINKDLKEIAASKRIENDLGMGIREQMLNSKLSNVSGVSGMSPVKSNAPSVISGMNQSNSMGRSATKFKKPMMPKLAMVDYEALMPAKEELLEKLEPFLKN